jgi:hypothetical protein
VKSLEIRCEWLDAHWVTVAPEVADDALWDWYSRTCPCGLAPGECRMHPRARVTQVPPEGDWRVWGYAAGRGAGKTRDGAHSGVQSPIGRVAAFENVARNNREGPPGDESRVIYRTRSPRPIIRETPLPLPPAEIAQRHDVVTPLGVEKRIWLTSSCT